MTEEQYALHAYIDAFVSEMAKCGVRHVCISPGSRSTPLALVMAAHPELKLWLHIDERSAGFFALGLAKATRQTVALVCTSGTAAANYLPAIVEARYGRVPLLALTADRPHELRDCGAPQAINQIGLYGNNVKWFFDMPLPAAAPVAIRHVRSIACRAVGSTLAAPAGPVHLNFPLREPLVPLPRPVAPNHADGAESAADPSGAPFLTLSHPGRRLSGPDLTALADAIGAARRGLILVGPQEERSLAEPLTQLAARLGFPVLADPLSQLRCGPHGADVCIAAYDALLRDKEFAGQPPDLVLRFGAMPTAKSVLLYLQQHAGVPHIVVDPGDGWNDPAGLASSMVHADPAPLCADLLQTLCVSHAVRPNAWLTRWRQADEVAGAALRRALADMPGMSECRVVAELVDILPEGSALYVGNSMPVRDLDTFLPAKPANLTFLANRGANGIDGVVSSALGAAAVWPGPLALAIGDLSFQHDLAGLLAAKLHDLHAVIVLINNNGGGIFSFLPQAEHPAHFEALFGTPLNLDFQPAVEMFGGRFVTAASWAEFRAAVAQGLSARGLTVVEVRTDRNVNVKQHGMVWQTVSAALRRAGM